MKFLITGFEPFGGESINPAWEAVSQLKSEYMGHLVVVEEIPVVFGASIDRLIERIELHQPDVVLCIGQAGGRTTLSVERVAININDARMPDNKGNAPIDEPIEQSGPDAYFTNLPIKAIVKTLGEHHIPTSISNSAGTYVCNHLMYGLLHFIHTMKPNIRGGFIHVPYAPSQVVDRPETAFMPVDMMLEGLERMIEVIAVTDSDIKKADHAIH